MSISNRFVRVRNDKTKLEYTVPETVAMKQGLTILWDQPATKDGRALAPKLVKTEFKPEPKKTKTDKGEN